SRILRAVEPICKGKRAMRAVARIRGNSAEYERVGGQLRKIPQLDSPRYQGRLLRAWRPPRPQRGVAEGCRRTPRGRVDIEVYDGQPRRFDATINLAEFQFLPHAAVVLEATCAGSSVIKRFEFGEVESIRAPQDRSLREIEGQNVFFALKVIDRTERF